jgi:hypothetical protein
MRGAGVDGKVEAILIEPGVESTGDAGGGRTSAVRELRPAEPQRVRPRWR